MENERFELQNVANTVEMAASSCKWQGKRAEKQTQHDPTKKTNTHKKTRRRMARERRGAESSVVSMETLYYKAIY